jgi:hypothetical protein
MLNITAGNTTTQDDSSDLGYTVQPTVIAAGQAAWGRLKTHQTWNDWRALGAALAVGRTEAMGEAGTNRPFGSKYCEFFKQWLTVNGFSDLDDNRTRARLLSCVENIDAIEAWRTTLEDEKRLKLNHPATVWSAWKRSTGERKEKTHDPAPDLLVAWNKATSEEKKVVFEDSTLNEFLGIMPAPWRSELMRKVVNLGGKRIGEPDSRITKIVQDALAHISVADAPKTSEPVAQSHEPSALDALREANRALHAIGRDLHNVEVILTTKTSTRSENRACTLPASGSQTKH